ncbi:1-acyl-sn-glycerol-3-phosphate acyltransferase [Phaeovibrio sulfidiphilus]|uniref:1-acyl-sn-glycerol-3-phosphate acyltransferase n=1 Tax=Phaeovibrio sulfidiphilus TaxID=1220600 RepID=A0A8J7CC19_9PROT|nr:1-acyl-sn-glycerol-3-phosphate acyltransferase [Phaeovibrio sulfidiphilus]
MSHAFPALLRLVCLTVWSLLIVGPYALSRTVGWGYRRLGVFHWWVCSRILGLDIRRYGAVSANQPLLVVSNHVSYLDIFILGLCIPGGVFVAKAEVAGWPGLGLLAKSARTIFIDRRRSATGQAARDIRRRFVQGDPLVLFPEGTSDDGNRVYPFKSALFSVADTPVVLPGNDTASEPWVQPVTLAYTRVDGLPMGRCLRPLFAWYGDMDLAPHAWTVLGFGRLGVDVIFHPPVRPADFASRKALSGYCQAQISGGLSRALSGRLEDEAPAAASGR